jgi:predicted enzyme related to lactoylglutathione lyase
MKNVLSWFEIPVNDMNRAVRFYEDVLSTNLRREVFFETPMAVFPYQAPGAGGALIQDAKRPVGPGGSLVYVDVTGRLDDCVSRVAGAGGEVVRPRTAIGKDGFIALIRDSEGNTIGLHSAQ